MIYGTKSSGAAAVRRWSAVDIESRIVRYADLKPCLNAFIDTRTPGSEKKENFTIIGPGVAENPDQFIHIAEPHGFNIGGARQPPGCVNSQHSHETAEVFVVHSGCWSFNIGEHGADAKVALGPGDVISLPTRMFRGFTNIGGETGFLFAVLGGDDPGRVLWAPHVFDMAQDYGLVLLENGTLIDTVAGARIPSGARVMARTTKEQVDALWRPSQTEAERLGWRASSRNGRAVTQLIGKDGPFDWEHGFALERLDLQSGDWLGPHAPQGPEVLFVHEGALDVAWSEGIVRLKPGDTMTTPIGLSRTLASDRGCVVYRVTG